ncbi:MAG: FG-GAP repeat protein [Myxococcota bacterium]
MASVAVALGRHPGAEAPLAPGVGLASGAYEGAGYALDAADVDGDGQAEILVGAPSYRPPYAEGGSQGHTRGTAYLLASATSPASPGGTLSARSDAEFRPSDLGEGVGAAVALHRQHRRRSDRPVGRRGRRPPRQLRRRT